MNELKEDVYRIMNEGSCIVTEQLGNKCIDQLMHLIETYTTRKELEARIDELKRIDKEVETDEGFYDGVGHWFGESKEFRGASDYAMTYSCRRIDELSKKMKGVKSL